MYCRCGKEITNVPEHLKHSAKWICKACGQTVENRRNILNYESEPVYKDYKREQRAA